MAVAGSRIYAVVRPDRGDAAAGKALSWPGPGVSEPVVSRSCLILADQLTTKARLSRGFSHRVRHYRPACVLAAPGVCERWEVRRTIVSWINSHGVRGMCKGGYITQEQARILI